MESEEGITTYHISTSRHLSSSTPPGHVPKHESSMSMCERMFSILFLVAIVSCKLVSQRGSFSVALMQTLGFVEMASRIVFRGLNPAADSVAISKGSSTVTAGSFATSAGSFAVLMLMGMWGTSSTVSPKAPSRTRRC